MQDERNIPSNENMVIYKVRRSWNMLEESTPYLLGKEFKSLSIQLNPDDCIIHDLDLLAMHGHCCMDTETTN
jgi:hypothetical protein